MGLLFFEGVGVGRNKSVSSYSDLLGYPALFARGDGVGRHHLNKCFPIQSFLGFQP